ncbi:glycosyltransferase [Nonlabens sp.]|jgi:glycosyltransferase involved in cell wall biosynthesis|uniref:glycosyltransferase n=1 Tax=Nonlabens sp. TaxID=1888209 RepID=UPI003F69B676
MKILQIIDSLDAGGAERMAVNIANDLQNAGHESHLCVTRKEGLLKKSIQNEVSYLFLERKGRIGWTAILQLRNYLKTNKIEVVHAHSTSAFITVSSIVTLQNKPKFIWHDHYGKANQLHSRPTKLLNYLSRFFDHIISVNSLLKDWAIEKLRTKEVTYLENFAVKSTDSQLASSLIGNQGKRIICLANLREQKDHFNLIHAFEIVYKTYPEWTLHLCGQDFNDVYSSKVKNLISEKNMQNAIFLLGSRSDVSSILEECDIAVLSSKSEGLPVALLEYGLHQLPVITTDVGACAEVVQNYGIVVPLKNAELLATAIKKMIASKELRENYATQFHNHIVENYGSDRYVEKLLEIYNQIH